MEEEGRQGQQTKFTLTSRRGQERSNQTISYRTKRFVCRGGRRHCDNLIAGRNHGTQIPIR